MKLRCYQDDALRDTAAAHAIYRSVLVLMATGLGKTVVFAHYAERMVQHGRVLVIAHREELIDQAADKILRVTGIVPEYEKAERWATDDAALHLASPIVVASIQTLVSGPTDRRRMHRFDPSQFALVIVDEGHRGAAPTYQEVVAWFGQNKNCKFLFVTATGDRADGQGLGVVIEHRAYRMELPDAVKQGWLVPVRQVSVAIDGLDFSKCRTTGGDLNPEDLEATIAFEGVLHGIVYATLELAGGIEIGSMAKIKKLPDGDARLNQMLANRTLKQTLVFAPSVALSERMAEIFCRWLPDCARSVCGETHPKLREEIIGGFRGKAFPILCNVGIATEGADFPSVEIVVMGRPTKSRVLATQMVGRGTRPAMSIADSLGDAMDDADRVTRIAASEKPWMTVLDFVGNSGRHRLVSAVDVLAGETCDPLVLDRATELVRAGEAEDVQEAIAIAEVEIDAFHEAKQREAEVAQQLADEEDRIRQDAASRRASVVATADYSTRELAGVSADAEQEWFGQTTADRVDAPVAKGGSTEPQVRLLVSLGVKQVTAIGYGKRQAGAVIDNLKSKRCADWQSRQLRRYGYSDDAIASMNFYAAAEAINAQKAGAA